MNEKVISILRRVYNCAVAEEDGSAEHITEWVDSDEIREVLKEAGVDVSDLNEDD